MGTAMSGQLAPRGKLIKEFAAVDIRIQGQKWVDTWVLLLEKLESHGGSGIEIPDFVVDVAREEERQTRDQSRAILPDLSLHREVPNVGPGSLLVEHGVVREVHDAARADIE